MIKNFETYINEDYFSKLASRKDNGEVRRDNILTEEEVLSYVNTKLCRVENVTIDKNNVVNIDGDFVFIAEPKLVKGGKLPFKFGKVTGDFDCSELELTTLEGCPDYVGRSFSCSENKLTTLEYCPKKIGEDFNCSGNELTSVEGGPEIVNGNYSCSHNRLKTLKGCPKIVKRNFKCVGNELESLEGGPEDVWENYRCKDNKLKNFKGCPTNIHGVFSCSDNDIESLEGFPKYVEKRVYFQRNRGIEITEQLLDSISSIRGEIIING